MSDHDTSVSTTLGHDIGSADSASDADPGTPRLTRGAPRFLTLADVADALNISGAQVYALVRRGELRGIKIGGRGQWRVESSELERYITAMYDEAARFVSEHPFTGESLMSD